MLCCVVRSGAYGSVFNGEFRGSPVAIKVLNASHLNDDARRDFQTEIELMLSLPFNPYLVGTVAACLEGSEFGLLMEYVENGSLSAAIHGGTASHAKASAIKLSMVDRIRIGVQIARGMRFLHGTNDATSEGGATILHFDLKPGNSITFDFLRLDSICLISCHVTHASSIVWDNLM